MRTKGKTTDQSERPARTEGPKKVSKTEQFDRWFTLQFGGLPDGDKLLQAEKKAIALRWELARVEEQLREQTRLAALYNAALKSSLAAENGHDC